MNLAYTPVEVLPSHSYSPCIFAPCRSWLNFVPSFRLSVILNSTARLPEKPVEWSVNGEPLKCLLSKLIKLGPTETISQSNVYQSTVARVIMSGLRECETDTPKAEKRWPAEMVGKMSTLFKKFS